VVQPDIREEGSKEMVETVDSEQNITMAELDYLLRKAKNRKSPGIDNLK
jgi:hypothetical protein